MIQRPTRMLWLPAAALVVGCASEPTPELELIAYGTEPAWTIRVWSDSLTLDIEGDHGSHVFETRRSGAEATAYETTAGEATLRLELAEADCPEAGREARAVTLSFGSQTYAGCGRAPDIPITRVHEGGGVFATPTPRGWTARDESRGDTTAVTWQPPDGGVDELTVIALPLEGGFTQETLIDLAESFARARFPALAPRSDEILARPEGIRVPFVGSATDGEPPPRVVVDIEQEPGRLRLVALVARTGEDVWAEESLLLGGFRWLTPPRLPPEADAPAAES